MKQFIDQRLKSSSVQLFKTVCTILRSLIVLHIKYQIKTLHKIVESLSCMIPSVDVLLSFVSRLRDVDNSHNRIKQL